MEQVEIVGKKTAHIEHACPACRRKYRYVAPALACWLKDQPQALSECSFRVAGRRLSCSYEAVRLAAQELGVDTSIAGKKPGYTRLAGPRKPRRRRAPSKRKSNWWKKLRADPERYALYLKNQRRRTKERWRDDPAYRKARLQSLGRWRRKKLQQTRTKRSASAKARALHRAG